MPLDTSKSLPTKIDTLLIELTQNIRKNIMDAKTDFNNFIWEHDNTSLHTKSYEEINTNAQKQTDKNSEENFNYQEETSINSQSNYSSTKDNKDILYTTKNIQEILIKLKINA